jgi:hypothetical protein
MKAVIYACYSSDGQREESIERQLLECIVELQKQENTTIPILQQAVAKLAK